MAIELGVLGVGHLATAVLEGVFEHGILEPAQVLVADTNPARLEIPQACGCPAASTNEDLRAAPRLLLAVRPQTFDEAAGSLGELDESHLVISVMAGVRAENMSAKLGSRCRIVRVMPNAAAGIGQSMTAIARCAGATDEDLDWTTALFDAVGSTRTIDESLMSAATAVCGSGPGWLNLLASAMVAGACDAGFDRESADVLVRQTLLGASGVLHDADSSIDELIDAVATAGGTTEAGIIAMQRGGFEGAVRAGILAARDRGDELST